MDYFYIILAYFVGAIPFSYLVPKMLSNIDVSKIGSKNIGTSNAVWAIGFKKGILCFLGDFFKGFLVYFLGINLFSDKPLILILIGISAVTGHLFSVYLGFKGGKGIATILGILFAINPIAGIIYIIVDLIITFSTKYIAMGNVLSLLIIYITSLYFKNFNYIDNTESILLLLLLFLIIPKHIENFIKIYKGKEIKFYERKK